MLGAFGQKLFLLHGAQGLPRYVVFSSYEAKEAEFKKCVKTVPISYLPLDANIIWSHTVYKLKVLDDHSLTFKASISLHGNEDSLKKDLQSYCLMCSPIGIRIVLSLPAIYRWPIPDSDAKSASLQTGDAQWLVYARMPCESCYCLHHWLVLAAAYGFVNTNAKLQSQADDLILCLGLYHMAVIQKLLYQGHYGFVAIIVIKCFNNLLLTSENASTMALLRSFNSVFELGNVVRGPGTLKVYDMSIIQSEDYLSIDADGKLPAVENFPISQVHRRQCHLPLSAVAKSSLLSVNYWIGLLWREFRPVCSLFLALPTKST